MHFVKFMDLAMNNFIQIVFSWKIKIKVWDSCF